MTKTSPRLLLALAIVVIVATAAPPVLGADTYPVDSNHALASQTAIDQYQSDGHVSGRIYALDASLTVSDTADHAGLSDVKYVSSGATFIRLTYREGIARTLRIHIPSEYVTPRLKHDLESVDGSSTASFQPSDTGDYMVMTVTVTGETTAVWRLPWHRGAIADSRARLSEEVNETTGWSLPKFSRGNDWQYIPSGSLENKTTYALETNGSEHTIQYDADESTTEQWITVRKCSKTDSMPVCTFTQAGRNNTTFLLSRQTDTPRLRYRVGTSKTTSIQSSINNIQNAIDNLLNDVQGFFGDSSDDTDSTGGA